MDGFLRQINVDHALVEDYSDESDEDAMESEDL